MTDRILDVAERPARLRVENGLLVIEPDNADKTTLPLTDIAVLIVSHPQVSYTQAVLAGLARAGAAFVACDERHMPAAMLLPLERHSTQGERFQEQADAPLPTKKRLWQQIVQAKLRAQARVLANHAGGDHGLAAMAERVRSGDPENLEARAAQRYWPALFGPDFRRNPDLEDQNAFLNYGYGVLRATVARAICSAGLHPCLGLHHHNRYDAFRLADDLMEPYRPLVDRAVFEWVKATGQVYPVDKHAKNALLLALTERIEQEGESRTLFDLLSRSAASLAAVFMGERKDLLLPEL